MFEYRFIREQCRECILAKKTNKLHNRGSQQTNVSRVSVDRSAVSRAAVIIRQWFPVQQERGLDLRHQPCRKTNGRLLIAAPDLGKIWHADRGKPIRGCLDYQREGPPAVHYQSGRESS